MHIDSLRIDDFGCFRNARLDNLSESLVVIGGPQRAGKTTFMEAIRQFRSGVSRGGDLPPANDEYRVDAEIIHAGDRYRYVLDGHAAPSISPIDGGPTIGVDDVFGPVTDRQYKRLFTISLDELQRIPPGIEDSEDLAKVLLGGAYGDIADIPEVQAEFDKQANDIGLTRGDPKATSTQLHRPYKKIQEGMDDRHEASEQVDEHRDVTEDLEAARDERAAIDNEVETLRRERDRLDVLEELFDPLQQLEGIEAQLKEADVPSAQEFPTGQTDRLEHLEGEFEGAVERLREAERAFERDTNLDNSESYLDWLLENQGQLDTLDDDRRVLERRVEDIQDEGSDLDDRRRDIESEIADHHPEWKESFDYIEEVATNSVDTGRVEELTSELFDVRDKRETLEGELDSKRTRLADLRSSLSELQETDDTKTEVTFPKRKPMVVAGAAVIVGTVAGIVATPLLGGAIGLALLLVGMYVIDSSVTVEPTFDTEPRQELKAQISTLDSEISANEDRLEKLTSQYDETEDALEDLTTELGLPEDLPTASIASFYDHVVDLADRIDAYRRDREDWDVERDTLSDELEVIDALLDEQTDSDWSKDAPLDQAPELLAALESATRDLDLAREVDNAMNDRAGFVEDIDAVLTAWTEERGVEPTADDETIRERIREFHEQAEHATEILDAVDERENHETQIETRMTNDSAQEAFGSLREDDEPWIDVIRRAVNEYANVSSIEDEREEIQREITDLKGRRESLRTEIVELETRRDELASEEDLQAAQAKIAEGRLEFERVGEAYAVNRVAEAMVNQLHERLMAEVVHSLVDDASDIFETVTQEYDGIELGGEIQDLEFRAVRDGRPDHGIGELSGGTAEQLFLAIRLARIRQTEVQLPVVFDDAATNFDPDHAKRVFEIVGELAATNQVFFLTCHPAFVNLTTTNGVPTQYWSLEDRDFTMTDDADGLERRLTAD